MFLVNEILFQKRNHAMNSAAPQTAIADANPARVTQLFREQLQSIIQHTDWLFSRLMILQWLFGIGLALWLSPRTWEGTQSSFHPHVLLAVVLGGAITFVPVLLAMTQPGKTLTRHVVAIGQMLMSGLLIHLTNGRIETHFHVFGSLAILAFYRDWTVLVSASLVVYLDHLVRGFFIPQSVYGVLYASTWRSLEHAGWVAFEVVFLIIAIRKSLSEMMIVAERQANLEAVNESVERTVAERTSELAKAQQIARLGSWYWDLEGNTVSWSDETRRLCGFRPEDSGFTMEKCLERVHPDDLARVRQVFDEALRTHESCRTRARSSG